MDTVTLNLQDEFFKIPPERHPTRWKRVKTTLRGICLVLAIVSLVISLILLRSSVRLILPVLPITAVSCATPRKDNIILVTKTCMQQSVACFAWNLSVLVLSHMQNVWISHTRPPHIVIDALVWVLGGSATLMQATSTKHGSEIPDSVWPLLGSLAIIS